MGNHYIGGAQKIRVIWSEGIRSEVRKVDSNINLCIDAVLNKKIPTYYSTGCMLLAMLVISPILKRYMLQYLSIENGCYGVEY